MDTKKIGAFIASCRKAKRYTQQQLAEKLGVTNKTVSRWETGKYMPDLSLLKPLCEELDITLNELLSGEKIDAEHAANSSEENISNTIEYALRRITGERRVISALLIIAGILFCCSAFLSSDTESRYGVIVSAAGLFLIVFGIFRELPLKAMWKKLCVSLLLFILFLNVLCIVDYMNVVTYNRPPVCRYMTESIFSRNTKMIRYSCPFYKVYRINTDTVNEYYIIDTKNEYTEETVPLSPFDREKSGIRNLLNYRSPYIGDNSNAGNLLNALPLSEFGFVFEIDPDGRGLTVDYHSTDWYSNDDLYIEKALVYNSVCIFLLIDNIEYINWNFSGSSYHITREAVEAGFPDYAVIKSMETGEIDLALFDDCLESKMNDNAFVSARFLSLFIPPASPSGSDLQPSE